MLHCIAACGLQIISWEEEGRKGGCSANGGTPVEASAHSGEKEEERPQARSGESGNANIREERERERAKGINGDYSGNLP